MIYFILLYALIKLYLIINIYQQAHYQIKDYFFHFLCNFFLYDFIPLFACICGLMVDRLAVTLVCGIYINVFASFFLFMKKKLVFTKRVIRCFISYFIVAILIAFIPYVGGYLLMLFEFTLLPFMFLENKLSLLFNKKYLVKATTRLSEYKGKKIIVTGSYGKTSTKNLFNQLLNVYSKSVSTPQSYNTPLGIAKFVNETPIELYDYLVLEYGSSKPKDIAELQKLAFADVAVVTEIGYMHLNGFKSIENIIEEKMSLLKYAKVAILNVDNPFIREYPIDPSLIVLSYGFENGMYQARNIYQSSFDFYYRNQFVKHFTTKLIGKHQISNLMAGIAYAHYMHFDLDILERALLTFKVEDKRLQIKHIGNRILLDDSFNSNLNGFVGALKILGSYNMKRIVITPGIVELGKYTDVIIDSLVVHLIANSDVVILVGYHQTKKLYYKLKNYPNMVYVARNFMEAYSVYLEIVKNDKRSALLIENDLPDIYRRGFRW